MGNVTAKVLLAQKTSYVGGDTLKFTADYQDGRNKEWSQSTPSLTFEMQVKPDIARLFEVGGKYTVTFEESED